MLNSSQSQHVNMLFSGAQPSTTDFSGKWKLNRSASQLNAEFSMAPFLITVTQEKNSLTAVRTSNFQGEEYVQTNTYSLDGKDSKNSGFQGAEVISQASWAAEGKSLEIKASMSTQNGGEMTINTTYKMEGNNLSIENKMAGSWGEIAETWVYDKE